MSCTLDGSHMHIRSMREEESPSDCSNARDACLSYMFPSHSHFVPGAHTLLSHFERQPRPSYRQSVEPSSASALTVRHAPSPMGGLIAWYTTCIRIDMPRSSLMSRNRTTVSTSRWGMTASVQQAIGSRSYASLAGKFISARGYVGWQRCKFCPLL